MNTPAFRAPSRIAEVVSAARRAVFRRAAAGDLPVLRAGEEISAALTEGRPFMLPPGMWIATASQQPANQPDNEQRATSDVERDAEGNRPATAVVENAAVGVDVLSVSVVQPLAEPTDGEADPHQREVALMEAQRAHCERHAGDDQAFVPMVALHEPIEPRHSSAPSDGVDRTIPPVFGVVDGDLRLVPRTGDLVDRRDMTDPTEIVELMARDILTARRAGDESGAMLVLLEAGWTWAQASRFGLDGQDLALTPAFAMRHAVDDRRAAEIEDTLATRISPDLAPTRVAASTGDMATMLDHIGAAVARDHGAEDAA